MPPAQKRVGVLTVTGNEITDLTRALNVQGDGRAVPDSSYGIWPARTNLWTNGGAETNATGYNNVIGASTRTSSTEQFKFGTRSLKVVTPGAVNFEGTSTANIAVSSSTKYTVSCWILFTAGAVAINFDAVELNAGLGVTADHLGHIISAAAGWRRFDFTFTTTATSVWLQLRWFVNGTAAQTFYLDGVQAEAGPNASPYIETNGSTASRAAARVQFAPSMLDAGQSWVAMRLRMGFNSSAPPDLVLSDFVAFLWAGNPLVHYNQIRYVAGVWAGNRINVSAPSVADTFAQGDMRTIVFAWSSIQTGISINGAAFVAGAGGINTIGSNQMADIGTNGIYSNSASSDALWFAIGRGQLTNADAAAIHLIGNTDPTQGSFPIAADCTGVWTADNSLIYGVPSTTRPQSFDVDIRPAVDFDVTIRPTL